MLHFTRAASLTVHDRMEADPRAHHTLPEAVQRPCRAQLPTTVCHVLFERNGCLLAPAVASSPPPLLSVMQPRHANKVCTAIAHAAIQGINSLHSATFEPLSHRMPLFGLLELMEHPYSSNYRKAHDSRGLAVLQK